MDAFWPWIAPMIVFTIIAVITGFLRERDKKKRLERYSTQQRAVPSLSQILGPYKKDDVKPQEREREAWTH